MGDRRQNIEKAVALIGERVGEVVRQSSLMETEPWGFASDNLFLNGVVLCQTELSPREVLQATQKIERELGRKKSVKRGTRNEERGTRNEEREMRNELSTVNSQLVITKTAPSTSTFCSTTTSASTNPT